MAKFEAEKYDLEDVEGQRRRELAARYYSQGSLHPYDGPIVGAGDWAIRAARGILEALLQRKVLLVGYSQEIREDTVLILAEVIRHAASENGII